MGILARLRLAKIQTMARPNSPDATEAYQKGTIRYKNRIASEQMHIGILCSVGGSFCLGQCCVLRPPHPKLFPPLPHLQPGH